jgi:hypothetical protein
MDLTNAKPDAANVRFQVNVRFANGQVCNSDNSLNLKRLQQLWLSERYRVSPAMARLLAELAFSCGRA